MSEDSAPFALVVRFTLLPGSEEAFDALTAATTAAIRASEPGTLVYACHRVEQAPQQRIFYELYADRAAFDAHEGQPHVRHFLQDREALLEGVEVDFLSLADGKTPAAEEAA
jgi:quinol monooxygenase YgiN